MEVALASRQPLSEVQSWCDEDLVTVLQVLDEQAAAKQQQQKKGRSRRAR